MTQELKLMKDDFIWVRKILSSKDNKCTHYNALKNLIEAFSYKWKVESERSPDIYWAYVNYLRLKLRFEFSDD